MKTSFTSRGSAPISSAAISLTGVTWRPALSRRRAFEFMMFSFGVFAVALTPLAAKEKKDLEIVLTAQTVSVDSAGVETLRNEVSVNPGDVVQYTALYRNTSAHALGQLAPTLPIPTGMEYVAGSASPAPAEASLDGKKFEPVPIRRAHKLPGGLEVFVEIPASSYRALRWKSGDLAPEAAITLSARTRIAAGR